MATFGLNDGWLLLVAPLLGNPLFAVGKSTGPLVEQVKLFSFVGGNQGWVQVAEFPPPFGYPHYPYGWDVVPDLH